MLCCLNKPTQSPSKGNQKEVVQITVFETFGCVVRSLFAGIVTTLSQRWDLWIMVKQPTKAK